MYKKYARYAIILVVLLTIVNGYFLSKIQFGYNFEDFFDKGDKDFQFYDEFRARFGDDNNYILLALENKNGVFDPVFVNNVDRLTTELKNIDEVTDVISPTTLKNQLISPAGIVGVPFIHVEDSTRFAQDSSLIYSYDDLIGTFFSEDGEKIALIVKTVHLSTADESKKCMTSIYEMLDHYPFDKIHFAGKVVAEVVYVEKITLEFLIFFSISSVMIVGFLVLAFRSVWGIMLPLTVVMLSVMFSLGIMAATGKNIDILTVLLPSIMLVVGMSDVIHIITKYLDELRFGREKIEAIKITFKEVGLATLLTSITTAVGFLTLMTVDIVPIQDFGMYSAIGVLVAFALAFLVIPAALVLMKTPEVSKKKVTDLFWYTNLHKFLRWILHFKKVLLIGSIVLVFVSAYGISLIRIDSKLIDEVKDGDPLKEDFVFFETHFSGARPFELAVEMQDSTLSVFDYEVIQELNRVQNNLMNEYEVNNIVSPVTIVKTIHRAMNGGLPAYFTVPENKAVYKKIYRIIKKIKKSEMLTQIVSDDWKIGRFSGNMHDLGLIAVEKKKDNFNAFADANFDKEIFKLTVTGSSLLIDKSNKSLSSNMIEGLSVAFIIISIIMGVLYRSVKMIVIALIPNIIPLMLIGAIMGYTGIELKMSTAIIFTIAFGIAVDDTIHFMSKLKLELAKGKSSLYAMKRAFLSTGKAIIVTSCILSAGFMILVFSQFKGSFYTGLLVSLTLIFAVLADLILIPILITYFYKKPNTNSDQ